MFANHWEMEGSSSISLMQFYHFAKNAFNNDPADYLIFSLNKADHILDPELGLKHLNPYYQYPQKGTLNFGKPETLYIPVERYPVF